MKNISIQKWMSLIIILSNITGCKLADSGNSQPPAAERGAPDMTSSYIQFAPEKIDIMPLTELVRAADTQKAQINLYIRLLDKYNSQIKAPGIFRFELYEHVQRSSEPKGKRIVLWPDIDLSNPADNNKYWRDFLRAYEFNLSADTTPNPNYILEVTCLCSRGRRLTDEFILTRRE